MCALHSPQGRSLQEVLECEDVTKLLYDVRCDAEALYHQHGVRLGGAVDLQLAEVARGEGDGGGEWRSWGEWGEKRGGFDVDGTR